jgi:ribosomal protein S18 acetylase RimI-like enzyme
MIVRKANESDKKQIQALMDELNLYRKKIFSFDNQQFHERINPYSLLENKDFDEYLTFVAIDDSKKIIGFVQGSIHTRNNHKLSHLGYIDELYVKEEARGQGVAKKLFLGLGLEFKKQKCDHMITHTDFENELSQQFYLQVGMHKATIELWKEL